MTNVIYTNLTEAQVNHLASVENYCVRVFHSTITKTIDRRIKSAVSMGRNTFNDNIDKLIYADILPGFENTSWLDSEKRTLLSKLDSYYTLKGYQVTILQSDINIRW